MDVPQDHDQHLLDLGGSPAALIRHKEAILVEFGRELRARLPGAEKESDPIIINTLPAFITRLALALSADNEISFASEYSNIAVAHGNERARLTHYSLAEVIHEYRILREILVRTLRADGRLTHEEWDVVHRSIDEAIAEAAAAFVQVHQGFRDLFMAALSHDFRAPLANAMNYVALIGRDAEPALRGHFAGRTLYNLNQIDRMIRELLDISRADAGVHLTLNLQNAEAGGLASDVIGDLVLRAGDRFVLEIQGPVRGCWDPERLKQALTNLLENAVKYGRDGTPITCRVGQIAGRMTMSVHNMGDPIAPEQIPTLFLPFRRTQSAEGSSKSGWGLGLVMVQRIAEAHGGSVTVESSESSGTVFTLDILLDAREKQPRAAATVP
jgi:signal transduction histidine kinase